MRAPRRLANTSRSPYAGAVTSLSRFLRAVLVSCLLWTSQGALSTVIASADSVIVAEKGARPARRPARTRVHSALLPPNFVEPTSGFNFPLPSTCPPPLAAPRAPRQRLHLLHGVLLI
jgi:hypothetical protein